MLRADFVQRADFADVEMPIKQNNNEKLFVGSHFEKDETRRDRTS